MFLSGDYLEVYGSGDMCFTAVRRLPPSHQLQVIVAIAVYVVFAYAVWSSPRPRGQYNVNQLIVRRLVMLHEIEVIPFLTDCYCSRHF